MSKIKLTGDTSGYVEISAPNVAANNTLELGGGTKILTNLDNVFTGVTTYSGNIDLNANLDLDDNNKILLGTSDDLQVYHDGTHSHIREVGTGDLRLRSSKIQLMNENSQEYFVGTSGGSVELFHSDVKKFETTTTGATVTGTLVSDSVTSELDLSAISSSISDTAVDVFVYDTRKDSDGGAWRKRTQHTSWYNETLNTATRGSRKEFPAVAVIVAENDTLTIYDGDDPDLPMWMVFNAGNANGNNMIGRTNESTTCTSMLNGLLCVGREYFGFHMINFIADRARFKENGYDTPYTLPIGTNRNGGNTWLGVNVDGNDLVNDQVNDVAMTVLPNAPIDDATGLPVPTIAVATDGGVSVIKDDGTVVDIRRTSDDDVHHVDLDGDRVIMFMELGAIYVATIPGADQSGNPNSAWTVYGSYGGNTSGTDHPAVQAYGAGVDLVSMKDHTFATAGFNNSNDLYKGLSILSENLESSGNGMVAWIRSDCNTGYMHGDIKGAFLSDTDATNITGGNIVTNGDAWTGAQSSTSSTPPNGWTGGNAAQWRTSTGGDGSYIRLVNAGSSQGGPNSYMYQAITTVPGKKYKISLTQYHHATISVYYYVGTSINGNQLTSGTWVSSSSNTPRNETSTFTATGTTTYLTLGITSGTNNYDTGWDNVLITEVVDDRSVNANGLHSFGTVTRSAVATGAELVGYGPFSTSNYLDGYVAYDFGNPPTIAIIFWQKLTNISNYGYGLSFTASGTLKGGISNGSSSSTYPGQAYFNMGSETLYTGTRVDDGNWHCLVGTIDGNTKNFYLDGKLMSSTTINNHDMSGVDKIHVGTYNINHQYPHLGSIALLRVSKSVPSAEQIKKMYEDEKVLFQENAKATLYGSSDAVTALGYDEDTELLHVGTSAGRSDFQGLRRINNTTTAVTTAISASDDLIAEQ